MMVSERRALAVVILGFYAFMWLIFGLMSGSFPFFCSMAALYATGVFSIAAGYFWARWFARGLGFFGAFMGAVLIWQAGFHPVFLFFCGTHVLLLLLVGGTAMAGLFEGQEAWRAKHKLDDAAVKKLGGTVTNVVTVLPYVAMYVFRPHYAGVAEVLAPAAIVLAALGTWALLRNRTWGLFAVAGAGVLMLASAPAMVVEPGYLAEVAMPAEGVWVIGPLLLLAVSRFAPEVIGFLLRRS